MPQLLVTIVILFVAASANASDINGDKAETILVPFAFFEPAQRIPGAHGTIWTGQVWLDNRNTEGVQLFSYCPSFTMCPTYPAGRIDTVYNPVSLPAEQGFLFTIPTEFAQNMTFSNRIFEETLNWQPRGVDIPVIREGNFFSGTQTFLGVPAGNGVRTSLRVYNPWISFDPPWRPGPALEMVRVEIRSSTQELRGTATLHPSILNPTTAAEDWHKPGFAAIYDLAAAFPAILDEEYIHIRLTPVPAGAQYWGMVAITDNDAQTVAIITAQ